MRILLVILAALVIAGGAGFYVMQGLQPAAPAVVARVEAPKLKKVFVPARELEAGTIITADTLSRMEITPDALTDQMVVADADGEAFLRGSVARQTLPSGVPIARSTIVQPGDGGFLAAVLPRGKRAVSIAISEVAGLNGLVLPGDRVDVIITYTVGGGASGFRASETVLSNIRVLALDQRLGAGPMDEEKKGKGDAMPIPGTATLEVTPAQAELVSLASDLGNLKLALNSVRDREEATTTPLASGLLSGITQARPEPRRLTLESDVTSTSKVRVVRGVKKVRASLTPDSGASSGNADDNAAGGDAGSDSAAPASAE